MLNDAYKYRKTEGIYPSFLHEGMTRQRISTRRLLLMSFFVALSLSLYVAEFFLPILPIVPGVKIGLANIVTIYVLVHFRFRETLAVLLIRIFLGACLIGAVSALPFSAAGGLSSLFSCLLLLRFLPNLPLWFLGAMGGAVHNTGQILIATIWLSSTDVFFYYPVLLLSGITAGLVTGGCAQLLDKRLNKVSLK